MRAANTHMGKTWLWIAGITLVIALAWGLERIVIGPLETGEAYPPYSSLRNDPVGTKALYESLAELPELRVERLYKSRDTLDLHGDDAMFVLGVDPAAWTEIEPPTLTEYEHLIAKGARLVIAFLPVRKQPRTLISTAVEKRWDIHFSYHDIGDPEGSIPRESALYFRAGPEWKVLDTANDRVTAVARSFGKGSVVLLAESYPLSNEGLREEHDAGLIAMLTGSAKNIVFDENHFGVVETGSVTKLMRKYHLEGALAVLGLVAALFLWRNASSLLPPRGVRTEQAVTGRDSLDAMTALLRRGIAEKDLLNTCRVEWNKSMRGRREITVVEGKDIAAAYRSTANSLAKRT